MVFVLHLSVSPERLLLLMLIAALVLGRAKLFLADWIPFLILFLSYEYLRGLGGQVGMPVHDVTRSEEHTSELQSRGHLVCRLLLEKKKNNKYCNTHEFNTIYHQ